MPVGDVRFIHASDFRLDRPLSGVAEVAGHLREAFVEAPYRAARRVFDVAIEEQVDFVVLAGGLLDAAGAGPRGVLFLQEQFQRLAERQIAVYWAGGALDGTDDWPPELELPDNVHHFPSGRMAESVYERDGRMVARLVGQSRGRRQLVSAEDFSRDTVDVLSIAVAHGAVEDADAPMVGGPDYWALGGRQQAHTFELAGTAAHYPGSPQGREPAEAGPHSCTLVRFAADGTRQSRPIVTDVLRWLTMRLRVDDHATQEAFERLLRDASKALLSKEAGADLLVTWSLEGQGALCDKLQRGTLADEWLAQLRGEFGFATPSLWSLAVQIAPPTLERYAAMEEESLFGDYLRTLRASSLTNQDHDLKPYLAEWSPTELPDEVVEIAASERDGIVRQAALLGQELLHGEVQPS